MAEVLLLDDDTVRSWYTLYQQAAFIAAYEALLKDIQADDVALFEDAVHPLHEVRPMGCRAPAGTKLGVQQTSWRDRLNVRGAIDLETGRTCMLEINTQACAACTKWI